MVRLVRAFDGHAEVIGLFLRELRELHADFFEVQPGDFFVELFGQAIDGRFVFIPVGPEVELREDLVGEGI